MPPKNVSESRSREGGRSTEFDEIMMELASMRSELKDVRERVKKIHNYIVWQQVFGAVKIAFVILIIFGAVSLFNTYFPKVADKVTELYSQMQSATNLIPKGGMPPKGQ